VDNLTRYERYLLKQGLAKYERAKTLDKAMCIVLNQEDERDKAEQIISKMTTAMWNGTVPGRQTVHPLQNATYIDPHAIYQSAENYK
jgi:hypothetical protein